MANTMSCDQVRSEVYAYTACSMPVAIVADFYRHLADCEQCCAHVTSYRSVIALLALQRTQRTQGRPNEHGC